MVCTGCTIGSERVDRTEGGKSAGEPFVSRSQSENTGPAECEGYALRSNGQRECSGGFLRGDGLSAWAGLFGAGYAAKGFRPPPLRLTSSLCVSAIYCVLASQKNLGCNTFTPHTAARTVRVRRAWYVYT